MSTKIYNGLKLNVSNINDLMKKLLKLRETFNIKHKKNINVFGIAEPAQGNKI
jgi:hypothetical protein